MATAKTREHFAPALDHALMYELEQDAASNAERGYQRRVMLAVCAGELERFSALARDDPEAFAAMRAACEDFAEHALSLAELAEGALQRLALAERRSRQH